LPIKVKRPAGAFLQVVLSLQSGSFVGEPNEHFAQHDARIKAQVEAFPIDGELAGLSAAFRLAVGL
jgi:hypothetical protein